MKIIKMLNISISLIVPHNQTRMRVLLHAQDTERPRPHRMDHNRDIFSAGKPSPTEVNSKSCISLCLILPAECQTMETIQANVRKLTNINVPRFFATSIDVSSRGLGRKVGGAHVSNFYLS